MLEQGTLARLFNKAAETYRKYSLTSLWNALFPPKVAPITYNTPDEWSVDLLHYKGENGPKFATTYIHEAPDPHGVVAYVTGWKGDPRAEEETIQNLQQAGFSVIAIALDSPVTETGSLPDNIELVKSFLFDKDAPMYKDFPADIPRFVVTHSTSGMLYQHAQLKAREEFDTLPDIQHTYHTAAFFDTAHSSRIFNPSIHKLFRIHARMNHDEPSGNSLIDRLYFYVGGNAQKLATEPPSARPTHGQISEISALGAEYIRMKQSDTPPPRSNIPQTFYISENDDYACPKTQELVAELEGAEVKFCRDEHNPLHDHDIRKDVIRSMLTKSGVLGLAPTVIPAQDDLDDGSLPALDPTLA